DRRARPRDPPPPDRLDQRLHGAYVGRTASGDEAPTPRSPTSTVGPGASAMREANPRDPALGPSSPHDSGPRFPASRTDLDPLNAALDIPLYRVDHGPVDRRAGRNVARSRRRSRARLGVVRVVLRSGIDLIRQGIPS